MATISGPPRNRIRNNSISSELTEILLAAADDVGVDHIFITSGGQPGTHGKRTGSTRHENGRAADLQLFINKKVQTFTNSSGGNVVYPFVSACAAYGATGIGAATDYMGNSTIHVGFGLNAADTRKLVWGRGGRSANAPGWLRKAASEGWNNPLSLGSERDDPVDTIELPALFVVAARDGLNLRKGPGLGFEVISSYPTGTEVTVLKLDGPDREWGVVDLQGDGLIDGHMFISFLAPVVADRANYEDVEEPD